MGRCDILVNNAGQARMSTFGNTTDEAWREELELKFFSQIYPVRAFKPMLDKSDAAAIIAVNSLLAYQPEPYMVATAAARAGAQSLVKSLAREFAPRIRVNSILLGLIDSGQWERRFVVRENKAQTRGEWFANVARERHIPMERLGEPDEVARAIAFLCSPVAGFITGAQLEISGGTSRHI
jgi:NAD(P)-dependent dehydrogenase (short-subunit alcohol dehydrogenase family)